MTDILRIKRRTTGSPGSPTTMGNAEIAYNEVDHILYYGEGGTAVAASTIVGIAGQGLASVTNPTMDGVVAVGVGTTWARGDHVHPTDTSRAPIASPSFTGVPLAATAAPGTSTTQLATTAFVQAGLTASVVSFNTRTGAVVLLAADVTGVGGALLASPTFTGTPAAPTALAGTNTTQLATTAFVTAAVTVAVPVASSTLPAMDGTATIGVGTTYARADHIHPTDTSRAPTAAPSFTGIVTIGGTITGAGMTAYFAAPPALGSTTPATGAFTTLSATGAVSGTGFSTYLASPPAIGGTAAAAGGFTSLTASGTVSGAGFTALLAPYALATSVPSASATTPIMDGTATIGVATTYARGDHIHPTDTSRAALASPIFTGNPTGPTPATANSSVSLATTAFVKAQGYAPLASPTFTGVPLSTTAANGTNNTQIATTAYVLACRQDQFLPPTVDVAWGSHKITGLADPTNPQDAATKNYVDGAIQGLNVTQPCRLATTANLAALSGLLTIDGVVTVAGDRVLVKDQTTQSANGIYAASAGAWTRTLDTDTWVELVAAYTFIEVGTVNADNGYLCTSDPGGTIGTTAVTWVQFSGAGQVIAGNGLNKVGNTLSVGPTAGRIAVTSTTVDIDAAYVGQASITTLGSVTTGTWNATTVAVARGGSGAVTLTGYLKGNGAAAFTAVASVPSTDITGLGTMSTQNANAVAITGGTIDNLTFDMGTF